MELTGNSLSRSQHLKELTGAYRLWMKGTKSCEELGIDEKKTCFIKTCRSCSLRQTEYGSPVRPQLLEAVVLHLSTY